MTYRVVGLGFGLLFLLVQLGCNDIVTPPPTYGPGSGGGGIGGDLCSDEGGPLVTIVKPEATSDPGADTLVTDPDLGIQCQVDSSGDPLVVIEVLGDDSASVTPAVANKGAGLFEATANLASFANGSLRVICEATSSDGGGACTAVAVDTLLDLGPGVRIVSPSASGAVFSGSMTVRYVLTALPVTESDTVDSVPASWQVVVAGQPIDSVLESQTDTTATFSATVDFDDPTLYETPLDGTYQLSVSAANGRGVTRTETLEFTVDAEGPGITIDEPDLGSVIGGATDVVATVADVSGIDPSQVSFYIGSRKFDMVQVPGSANRFRGSFDANQYPTTIGEVTIDVVAVDIVGNERVASVTVELDGKPPVLSLDPPRVREGKKTNDGIECSASFNPVGENAISDGDVVGTTAYIRARIEDRGNPSASYKAGLDYESAQVWILGDASKELVIDTDGDGVCDSLNPDVLPGNQAGNVPAVAIDLNSLPPTGSANYLVGQIFESPGQYGVCVSGTATEAGDPVCSTTTTPRVIPDNNEPSGSVPAIFIKPPVSSFRCMGDPFDWQTSLDGVEGPACLAVRAADERGNASVSAPIRVCFRKTITDGSCDIFDSNAYPCSDGCTGAEFPLNERIGPFE
jgi:hypothetical protein